MGSSCCPDGVREVGGLRADLVGKLHLCVTCTHAAVGFLAAGPHSQPTDGGAAAFLVWAYEVSPGEVALLTQAEVERRGLPHASGAWEDAEDEWTAAVKAAHPARGSGSHDEYGVAMRMVGHRHSKGELVALVNWLLVRIKQAKEA